jgi:hypothetical protein
MPDGDDKTPSISQEFADAFAMSEEEIEAAKAASLSGADGEGSGKTDETKGKDGNEDKANDGDGDETPDPLKDFTLDQLLQHPTLGPVVQSHADKVANSRITAEVDRAKTTAKAEGRTEVTQEQEERYFSSLSKEELARELAADEELAARYAAYQARKQKPAEPDEEAIAQQGQMYALATAIRANRELVEGSDLSADVKAELKGENFTKHGANALVEWSKAITMAFAKQQAGKLASEDNDEAREAARNEARLEADKAKPGGVGVAGRGAGQKPDLLKTPTNKLFEDAFA